MTDHAKPAAKPARPHFSSGPCAKRPGWSPEVLSNAFLGRSHRAKEGKARLKLAIDKTRQLLELPEDYVCGIVPGSDTGAFEMAMWSLLGERGVDALAWESFGKGWVTDILKQLKLTDVRVHEADYGFLPDLGKVDFDRDVVFTWNGTTSGVRVPDGNWIPADRQGLTLVDATSAAFAQEIDWSKVDVATFSWQKVLGGEAAHGMLILSPRALKRLETYSPPWPMPKVFRLTKGGKIITGIFEGETINTPSMLCVEDYLDTLAWAESIGGLKALQARADANAQVIFIGSSGRLDRQPGARPPRSNTSVCLSIVDAAVTQLPWPSSGRSPSRSRRCSTRKALPTTYGLSRCRLAQDLDGSTVEKSDLEADALARLGVCDGAGEPVEGSLIQAHSSSNST